MLSQVWSNSTNFKPFNRFNLPKKIRMNQNKISMPKLKNGIISPVPKLGDPLELETSHSTKCDFKTCGMSDDHKNNLRILDRGQIMF